ncbi:MAG: hypothetical protein ABFS45_24085 [Pseudomonadota bacterium]
MSILSLSPESQPTAADNHRIALSRGRADLADKIPSHKTLFHAGVNKGLPIGNLNSQFFANVYLNGLDQFVKHSLKCRYYLRYCDDFVLLSHDREQLVEWCGRIEAYLRDTLQLELNPRERFAPVTNGIDFLGYIVRRDYRLVRRRVVNHLQEKLRAFEAQLVIEHPMVRCYRFDENTLDALAATLSSYLGHFKPADCWNLWQSIWHRFPFLSQYLDFDAARWKLVRKYPAPRGLQRVKRQYRHFRWRFPDDVLLFQVGRFMECYDIGTPPDWERWLELKPMRWNRRGARYGFPYRQVGKQLQTLLAQGWNVTVIRERRSDRRGILKRAPARRYVPRTRPAGLVLNKV